MMHPGQLEPTVPIVEALVAAQFPQWGGLKVRSVASAGTVNAIFRLGDSLVARLPLQSGNPDDTRVELEHEAEAAAQLATFSPIRTPELVALGVPGGDYPLPWAIYRWLEGTPASEAAVADSTAFAEDLTGFVVALRRYPNPGLKFSGDSRGGNLADHDTGVRAWIADAANLMDAEQLTVAWESMVDTPRNQPDGWNHGDLMPGNLLVQAGRLAGVIDVGTFAVADPALDLQPAWNLFDAPARAVFRKAIVPSDDEWRRGMGWAFAQAVGCLAYYEHTNPPMSQTAHRTLTRLLACK